MGFLQGRGDHGEAGGEEEARHLRRLRRRGLSLKQLGESTCICGEVIQSKSCITSAVFDFSAGASLLSVRGLGTPSHNDPFLCQYSCPANPPFQTTLPCTSTG